MAFGAGASAKQWAKEAKREASAIRRYVGPFTVLAVIAWVWTFIGPAQQEGGIGALPDAEVDSLTFRAAAVTVGLWAAWVFSFGRLKRSKVQAAKAAAGRRDHGAKGEVAMGWHLAPLMVSKWYAVIHDRLIFKNSFGQWSDANWDHFVVTPAGIKMTDTKNYSGKAKWEVEGADLIYNNHSIRPNIQTAINAAQRVREIIRPLEKQFGKKIPVEACLAIYPHMRLKHGGYMTVKNVDGVLVMRFRDVRAWCMKGERVLSPKEIKTIKHHLKARLPAAAKSKR
jgi:hypothetical protein